MKDNEIRELVNTLLAIAVTYSGTQQLREHISKAVTDAVEASEAVESDDPIFDYALRRLDKEIRAVIAVHRPDALTASPEPAPAVPEPDHDEQAYDMARQIMQLVNETHLGGVTQLQAKIQCLIAETLSGGDRDSTSSK